MVHFSLNIEARCLYVIWEKQDQIWGKSSCIPKNMHSRTPMSHSPKHVPLLRLIVNITHQPDKDRTYKSIIVIHII